MLRYHRCIMYILVFKDCTWGSDTAGSFRLTMEVDDEDIPDFLEDEFTSHI
jgi:hypothetical protein